MFYLVLVYPHCLGLEKKEKVACRFLYLNTFGWVCLCVCLGTMARLLAARVDGIWRLCWLLFICKNGAALNGTRVASPGLLQDNFCHAQHDEDGILEGKGVWHVCMYGIR